MTKKHSKEDGSGECHLPERGTASVARSGPTLRGSRRIRGLRSRFPTGLVYSAPAGDDRLRDAEALGSLRNVWHVLKRVLDKAGLRHIRIHDLRYAYATPLLQAGHR